MARPHVFQVLTKLWHPAEGWREFPAGETDPGASWHDKEGGLAPGSATTTQALKDLIAAQDQIESLQHRLDSNANDLAESAKVRDIALAKVDGLEQRAIAAEKAQADAEEAARGYMAERDTARSEATAANAKAADLMAQVEALTAPPAKAGKPMAEA